MVDTRNKRAMAVGFVMPPRLILPTPDALALDISDRWQVAYSYYEATGAVAPPQALESNLVLGHYEAYPVSVVLG